MSSDDKRAEYVRRAEEARDAAKASANDQLKMVLYQIARLWDRLGRGMKALLAAAPAATACSLWMSECCIRMHFHCPCCGWLHI